VISAGQVRNLSLTRCALLSRTALVFFALLHLKFCETNLSLEILPKIQIETVESQHITDAATFLRAARRRLERQQSDSRPGTGYRFAEIKKETLDEQ
jgi:hypothetical protein